MIINTALLDNFHKQPNLTLKIATQNCDIFNEKNVIASNSERLVNIVNIVNGSKSASGTQSKILDVLLNSEGVSGFKVDYYLR